MLTENNLNIFNKIINEEIPTPNGTKSAKVVTHKDLDGLVSGVSMVCQLVKQGIPRSRITVELAQYGDDSKASFQEKFIGKKNQFVGVSDFAKLPKEKPFEAFNSLMNFKGKNLKNQLIDFIKNYKKTSFENFKKSFISTFNPTITKFSEKQFKILFDICNSYFSEKNKPDLTDIENVSIQLVKPYFVSDHHNNDNNSLSGGEKGSIAHSSKSEAEFLANKYAPGLWNQQDLKATSTIDSAGYDYDDLVNTVFLEKRFTGPNRKINLAILISTIFDNMCKKDEQAAIWVIKNSQPNLVSCYVNCIKAAKLSNTRLEYLSALKNGDVEKAKNMLSQFPEELNKSWSRRGEPTQPTKTYQDWQAKNKADLERNKTGFATRQEKEADKNITKTRKGSFRIFNNFMLQDAMREDGHLKNYPTRYMGSLLSQNGSRAPFTLKRYDSFIQMAKNPLYKGDVDFVKVMEQVYPITRKAMIGAGLSDFNVNRIMSVMQEKSGGHKGIFSVQGFELIKPTSKERGDAYWKAKQLEKSKTDSTKKLAKKVLEKYAPVDEKYKKIMNDVMDKTIAAVIATTNKLYPVDPELAKSLVNNDETFEIK